MTDKIIPGQDSKTLIPTKLGPEMLGGEVVLFLWCFYPIYRPEDGSHYDTITKL